MNTNTLRLEELPYSADSCELFDRIRDLPDALLLDSGNPHSQAGRFDILTADPITNLKINPENTNSYEGMREYFLELVKVHSSYCKNLVAPSEDIPFCGGIAGYLDYEAGRPLQHLQGSPQARSQLHFYQWAVIQDHLLRRCTLATLPSLASTQRRDLLSRLRQPAPPAPSPSFRLRHAFKSNMSARQYQRAVEAIQRYILAGDCYQVNLAQRFSSRFDGDPWDAYRMLRPLAAAHFAG
jgi:para-aminobenzoate synthetase component 1